MTAALALLLTLSLTLAACGGGDGDEPRERPTTERSTRTGPSETPTTEPEAETPNPTQTATKAETPAPTAEALRQRTPRPEATESAASRNEKGTREAPQATADEEPTASPTEVPPTEEARDEGLEWPWIDERITFETPHWTTATSSERREQLEGTLIAVTSHTHGRYFEDNLTFGDDCHPAQTMVGIAASLALVSPTGELRHMNGAQQVGWERPRPWQDYTLRDDITWESSNEEVLTWWEGELHGRVDYGYGWWPACHQYGETIITATHVNGSTASVKMEVTDAGYTHRSESATTPVLRKTCDEEKPRDERRKNQVIAQLEPWPWSLARHQRAKLIAESTGTTHRGAFAASRNGPKTYREGLDWFRDGDMRYYRRFITSSCLEEEQFEAVLEEFKKHPLVKDAWTREEVEARPGYSYIPPDRR